LERTREKGQQRTGEDRRGQERTAEDSRGQERTGNSVAGKLTLMEMAALYSSKDNQHPTDLRAR
jgi:hypothetical protein